MRSIFLSIMGVSLAFSLFAQTDLSYTVKFDHLGIRFELPIGWSGHYIEGGYVVSNPKVAGLILISLNEARNIEGLNKVLSDGISEGSTTRMQLKGRKEKVASNAIGGEMNGLLDDLPAHAYWLGVLHPQGKSLSILSASSRDRYSVDFKKYALAILKTMKFSSPKTGNLQREWENYFSNVILSSQNSYASANYADSGFGNLPLEKIKIELCGAGNFSYYSTLSNTAARRGGAQNHKPSSYGNSGRWKIVLSLDGTPMLELHFDNNEIYQYRVTRERGQLQLNGNQYLKRNTVGKCS